ncbi:aldo/keto reductase [Microbacterium sp. 18062]|uniref:aldo/keto reductase n=1 Tax=Microbacterium sp. 18062 TaxID=2681410 RepID=UPI00135C38FA|nr:aldo/keto reductase [Microbacterium sp. 18062]
MTILGRTGLDVFGLQLGGNPFGHTADEATSHAILDRYAAAGGNFIDTADVYSAWIDGNSGGESETIIGTWLASRRNRDTQIVATKVGGLEPYRTLTRANVRAGLDASLRRLQTDYVDLYYLHRDDTDTPQEETLEALDELVREGKVRHIGASNFTADRLRSAIEVSRAHGWSEFTVVQDDYSLVNRAHYEHGTREVALEYDLVNLPFRSLAKGFLAGKYRPGVPYEESTHTPIGSSYVDRYGATVLPVLDRLAEKHGVPVAAIGLAWVTTQPTIAVPLSGSRTIEQLEQALPVVGVQLAEGEAAELTALTEPEPAVVGS